MSSVSNTTNPPLSSRPACLNERRRYLGNDTVISYYMSMESGLAVMHYSCHSDARGLEFILRTKRNSSARL